MCSSCSVRTTGSVSFRPLDEGIPSAKFQASKLLVTAGIVTFYCQNLRKEFFLGSAYPVITCSTLCLGNWQRPSHLPQVAQVVESTWPVIFQSPGKNLTCPVF